MSHLIDSLHRVSQIADDGFAQLAGTLTPRQRMVLVAVDKIEDASQIQLVVETGIDRSTMTDIVRRLTSRGFITRKRTRKDARRYAVKLTVKGWEGIAETADAASVVSTAMLRPVPVALRRPFLHALDIICKNGPLDIKPKQVLEAAE